MARIKLKLGDNEVEVDSRDFYVDNKTVGEVLDDISHHMPENQARIVYKPELASEPSRGLEHLDDAEAYEPEFSEPQHIASSEIKSKLMILGTGRFFDVPRTVTETVEQLREHGWATSPLDVSKALAKMASNREIMKNLEENRTRYFVGGLTAS